MELRDLLINKRTSEKYHIYRYITEMSRKSLLCSCEVTINSALKRISKLEGRNRKALENEFREWINAIDTDHKNYDVLFINKIN